MEVINELEEAWKRKYEILAMRIDDTKKEILEANSKVCADIQKNISNKFETKPSSGTVATRKKVNGDISKRSFLFYKINLEFNISCKVMAISVIN